MHEAELSRTESGLKADGPGWFVLNAREAAWKTVAGGGTWLSYEAAGVPNQIGAGLHVLPPGESTGMYHREDNQEGFLVLEGQCLAIVEGEERLLERWDFFHCPPGTGHILVGAAGETPAVLFMFGSRRPDDGTRYLVDDTAARHGASVAEETASSEEAYGEREFRAVPAPWPKADGDERVHALEEMVRVLSAGLGLQAPLLEVPPAVREHLDRGEDVAAVKALRSAGPGWIGLVEAKRMVDALAVPPR